MSLPPRTLVGLHVSPGSGARRATRSRLEVIRHGACIRGLRMAPSPSSPCSSSSSSASCGGGGGDAVEAHTPFVFLSGDGGARGDTSRASHVFSRVISSVLLKEPGAEVLTVACGCSLAGKTVTLFGGCLCVQLRDGGACEASSGGSGLFSQVAEAFFAGAGAGAAAALSVVEVRPDGSTSVVCVDLLSGARDAGVGHPLNQTPTGCFMAHAADIPAAQYVRASSAAELTAVLCCALSHSHAWGYTRSSHHHATLAPRAAHRSHLGVTLLLRTGAGQCALWKLWDMAGPPPEGESGIDRFRADSFTEWCRGCEDEGAGTAAGDTIAPGAVWATARLSCSLFTPLLMLSEDSQADTVNEALLRCGRRCGGSARASAGEPGREARRAENVEAAVFVLERYALPAAQYLSIVQFLRDSGAGSVARALLPPPASPGSGPQSEASEQQPWSINVTAVQEELTQPLREAPSDLKTGEDSDLHTPVGAAQAEAESSPPTLPATERPRSTADTSPRAAAGPATHAEGDGEEEKGTELFPQSWCCCARMESLVRPAVERVMATAESLQQGADEWMRLEARTLAETRAVVQSNIAELEVLSSLAARRLTLTQGGRRSPASPAAALSEPSADGERERESLERCAATVRTDEEQLLLRTEQKVLWLEGRLVEARQRQRLGAEAAVARVGAALKDTRAALEELLGEHRSAVSAMRTEWKAQREEDDARRRSDLTSFAQAQEALEESLRVERASRRVAEQQLAAAQARIAELEGQMLQTSATDEGAVCLPTPIVSGPPSAPSSAPPTPRASAPAAHLPALLAKGTVTSAAHAGSATEPLFVLSVVGPSPSLSSCSPHDAEQAAPRSLNREMLRQLCRQSACPLSPGSGTARHTPSRARDKNSNKSRSTRSSSSHSSGEETDGATRTNAALTTAPSYYHPGHQQLKELGGGDTACVDASLLLTQMREAMEQVRDCALTALDVNRSDHSHRRDGSEQSMRLCEALGFLQATTEHVEEQVALARGRERGYLNTILLSSGRAASEEGDDGINDDDEDEGESYY